jgi:hypothetical protein
MPQVDAHCTVLEPKRLSRSALRWEFTRSNSPPQERQQRVIELPRTRDVAVVRRTLDYHQLAVGDGAVCSLARGLEGHDASAAPWITSAGTVTFFRSGK